MTEHSAIIETESGDINVGWSTLNGVFVQISQNNSISSQVKFSVEQAVQLASILLSACRTAGSDLQMTDPGVADELIALAERFRSDQKSITSADLRIAAGYMELLLKFDAGNALGAREA